jgi:hypothetical protein
MMNKHDPITPLPDIKRLAILDDEDTGEIDAIKKAKSLNALQFGIDIGRAIANTEHGHTPHDVKVVAEKIVDILGVQLSEDDYTSFMLGLGWGCSDRHKVPVEEEALDIK